jgi:hypothetical protein
MCNFSMCGFCGKHRALCSVKGGSIHWERRHDLCQRCFKSLRSAFVAQTLRSVGGVLWV